MRPFSIGCAAALAVGLMASGARAAVICTFSDSGVQAWTDIASTYVPPEVAADPTLSGITTTWAGSPKGFDWGANAGAASDKCLFTYWDITLTFSSQVTIPTIDMTSWSGGNSITVSYYTHAADASPAGSIVVALPAHAGGTYTGAWKTETGLAGIPLEKLYFAHPSSGDTVNIDNLGVAAVPEPATLSLLALGGLALVRRRR